MSKQSKWSREKNDSGWLADYNKKVDASFKEARDKVGSKLEYAIFPQNQHTIPNLL